MIDSIAYYDENAQAFFAGTISADMAEARSRFVSALMPGARVLDAGCGSGRDALAFKQRDFDVTAFDGSAEMVRMASAHTGLEVLHLTFDDVAWHHAFDGIWANASLLHVPRAQLVGVMRKLRGALVLGGVWELSFKPGSGEGIAFGRWFTNLSEADAPALIAQVGGLEILALTSSFDVRPGKSHEGWTNILVRRDE
jgi:SAM-dependent methyltransferase